MDRKCRSVYSSKQLDIPYSIAIKFLPNDSNTIVVVGDLDGNINIEVDERFSKFGDKLSIYLNSKSNDNIVRLINPNFEDFRFEGSKFLDFVFDGEHFISTVQMGSTEISIGLDVKNATKGIFYAKDGRLNQDSGHLFYDDINKRMGIGNDTPGTTLSLCGNNINGQLHVFNNDLNKGTSAIGFGKFGEEPVWLIGSGIGDDGPDVFSIYNTKTSTKYVLSKDENKITKTNTKTKK